MIAELNFVLAVATVVLAVYIGWTHYREHGFHHPYVLVGLTVISLGVVTILTAAPAALDIDRAALEPLRFVAAFFRGAAFVLLLAYALFRWEGRH